MTPNGRLGPWERGLVVGDDDYLAILALGRFDYSRHLITALARAGHRVAYGVAGIPAFAPEPVAGLTTFPIRRWERRAAIEAALEQHRPDVVFVGSAGYDGSNGVMLDLVETGDRTPRFRFYKEFLVRPSGTEQRVLAGADGVVAGGAANARFLEATYGLDPGRVHVMDPDLVSTAVGGTPHPKLSDLDGAPHVAFGGTVRHDGSEYDIRAQVAGLAERGVHVHVHAVAFSRWIAVGRALDLHSPEVEAAYGPLWEHPLVHLEPPVVGAEQLAVWGRYDAGLLGGRPTVHLPARTPFHDMNTPSKYSYYLAAGLPLVLGPGALPALRAVLDGRSVIIDHRDLDDLAATLHDRERMAAHARAVALAAPDLTIEAELPGLLAFVAHIRSQELVARRAR